MQLTGFTDLALRILMRLAVLDEGRAATTSELAEQLCVSYTHAAKVVTALSGLGVIDARRGRNGGLRLADGAHTISVGFIVRRLEGGPEEPKEVVDCDGNVPCPLRNGCRLRSALRAAQEAFFAALDPIMVADVAAAPTRSVLISLGPPPPPRLAPV